MEKPEEVRLIDLDETHSGEHTVFIMPPEEPQEPDGSECPALYRYSSALRGRGNGWVGLFAVEAGGWSGYFQLFLTANPGDPFTSVC